MSSPFRIFRKYQKTLLVIAGVLLMFVFVVGDSLTQLIRRTAGAVEPTGGQQPTDVAVEWTSGQLTNRELSRLVQRRAIVKTFIIRLYQTGQMAALQAGANADLPPSVELVADVNLPPGNEEQRAVQTRLFADAARQAGMSVSDEQIRHYLSEVGRRRVSSDQMRSLLSQSEFQGGRVPIDYVFEGLREELLARNYIAGYQFLLNSVSPQQRWEDWLRVNDDVRVEVAALPAQQLIVDVNDPSKAELDAFFEEYRLREPRPDIIDNTELPSPNPGFATPRRVKVHYVKADYNDFTNTLIDDVTDEEIEKFYEENKETLFVKADTSFDDFGEEETDAETEDEDRTEESTDDAATNETGAVEDNAATAVDEPADNQADPGESADSTGAAEPPADEAVEEEEEEEETETVIDDGTTVAGDEADAEAADDTSGDVADTESSEADAAAAETETDAAAGATFEKPVEYQPLEEVREEVRLAVARGKVSERLPELMEQLYDELRKVHRAWEAKVFAAEDLNQEPPTPPAELTDLEPLAEKHGLAYEKTGELTPLELRETALGRSGNPDRFGRAELWLAEYEELQPYEPALTYDVDINHYLSVKVADIPENVPTLDEIRDEVQRAWKLREAAQLALKRTEEMAQDAERSGLPLKEAFADDSRVEVTTTDPFSWLTIGNISPTTRQVFFRMSQPEGVVAPGPEFMRTVFALGDGEVGAVLNHDHSIAYVVRVVDHRESREALRQAFLSQANTWYGRPSMDSFHRQQAARALVDELIASNDVDWLRPADQPRE